MTWLLACTTAKTNLKPPPGCTSKLFLKKYAEFALTIYRDKLSNLLLHHLFSTFPPSMKRHYSKWQKKVNLCRKGNLVAECARRDCVKPELKVASSSGEPWKCEKWPSAFASKNPIVAISIWPFYFGHKTTTCTTLKSLQKPYSDVQMRKSVPRNTLRGSALPQSEPSFSITKIIFKDSWVVIKASYRCLFRLCC